MDMLTRFMRRLILGLIRGYQWTISPWLGNNCRFAPSCSDYALEAVMQHGPLRGSWLALKRLSRCHPWSAGGYDPVPARSGCHCAEHAEEADRGNAE